MTSNFSENNVYESRITLFLDILGFKQLVFENRQDIILDVLKTAQEFHKREPFSLSETMRVSAFSDHILISDVPGTSKEGFVFIMKYAAFLWWLFIAKGVLVRGGISVGNLYHEQGIVFGDSLIEAFSIESDIAIYPRIVITEDVYDGLIHYYLPKHDIVKLKKHGFKSGFVVQDFDGVRYVNVFHDELEFPIEIFPQHILDGIASTSLTFDQIKEVLAEVVNNHLKKMPKNASPNIKAKFDWLSSSLNRNFRLESDE